MKWTGLIIKSLVFAGLAALIVAGMIHFGFIEVESLRGAFGEGRNWLLLAFTLGVVAFVVNLVRYRVILRLVSVDIPFGGTAAATAVSLFLGAFLPGSMAVSEMVRLGLMIGAGKSGKGRSDPSIKGVKTRIFVASFLDRACGLILFLSVGTIGCLVALLLKASRAQAGPEMLILGSLMGVGLVGAASLLALPWLAKHPKILGALEKACSRFEKEGHGQLGKVVGKASKLVHKIAGPMTADSFSTAGFYKALAISAISNVAIVGIFYSCAQAVRFEISVLEIAAVFPFLTIAQLLPIGFGGIGGHQLVAAALFQSFSLEAAGVATVSLLFGIVSLLINTVIGVFFLQASAKQIKAIVKKPVDLEADLSEPDNVPSNMSSEKTSRPSTTPSI